ncbi:DUF2167 domain-containing protein [Luteimonas sp. Y-2-2-4F]|nr:DUF2167 domain-containing protein [Luteimonas sp. Y-2-2-4F]MCD9031155.1 DUF2167 domain-containing protein [Luteimonas sp. Y-2-2-4F]
MKRIRSAIRAIAVVACLWIVAPVAAQEQAEEDNPLAQLPWQPGPSEGRIGGQATIDVPEGYLFLGADGARRLNELFQNPPTGTDEYVLAPENLDWIAYFSFDGIGYVKDDEDLDPDAMLASIREGLQRGNEERRRRGWDTLRLVGWQAEPQYDEQLNALAWAILLENEASQSKVVNYNTRLLGRRGVMGVTLVADPEAIAPSIADFKGLVPGYEFVAGERYAEFRPGDHVAEIGLAALITGGAAAVASKKGWLAAAGVALAKFWKLLLVGIVGVWMAIRRVFKRSDDAGGK